MWELARKAHGHCHSEFFGKERAEELNHFDESCKFQKLNQFPFLGTQAEQPGSKRKKLGRKDGTIDWVSVQSIVSVYTLYPSLVFLCVFIPILFQESSYNVGGGGMILPMNQQYQVPTLHHVSHYSKSPTYEWVLIQEHDCKSNLFISSTKLA